MSETRSLNLRFRNTPEDIQEAVNAASSANLSLSGNTSWAQNLKLIVPLVLIVAAVIGALFQVAEIFRKGTLTTLVFSCILVAIFLILLVIVCFRQKQQTIDEDVVVSIDDKRIAYDSSIGTSELPWHKFLAFHETENTFALKGSDEVTVFVFPKREFKPDEAAWFRTLANSRFKSVAKHPTVPNKNWPANDREVRFNFTLNFLDYVNKSIASWIPPTFCIAILLFMQCFFLYSTIFNPPQAAVVPAWQSYLFLLGIQILTIPLIVYVVFTWSQWSSHKSELKPCNIVVSEEGIVQATADSQNDILYWNEATCFKESKRHFIVWWKGTGIWFLLPKRGLNDATSIERCRKILQAKSKETTWYW